SGPRDLAGRARPGWRWWRGLAPRDCRRGGARLAGNGPAFRTPACDDPLGCGLAFAAERVPRQAMPGGPGKAGLAAIEPQRGTAEAGGDQGYCRGCLEFHDVHERALRGGHGRPPRDEVEQDAAVVAERDRAGQAAKRAAGDEESRVLRIVDHVAVPEEAVLEQRLTVIASDEQDRLVPDAEPPEPIDQEAEVRVGMGERVPVGLGDALLVGGRDLGPRQRFA